MGMLDDAIREHLELKRLRGADPGQVAREERDALGPVRREADPPTREAEHDGYPAESEDDSADGAGAPIFDVREPAEEDLSIAGGQETAEINMEAELEDRPEISQAPGSQTEGLATPVSDPAHTQPSSGDSLEWEVPADRKEDLRGAGPADERQTPANGPREDVLEETPDFLRETPEQERLWFEQRPPRDFDFNE